MEYEITPQFKIAIAGFGVEGRASYEYYSRLGADITIVDEKEKIEGIPEGVKTLLGEGVFEKLHEYDLVIRSPQINPARIVTHGKIWSATNEFFEKCPAPIIGVTGTKGKGTTSTLIADILRNTGKEVHLVGNIGVPALDVIQDIAEEDIVVFELSSFQLWDIERSPQTAVVLMIEPDHMDVHASMDEYVNAKRNITYHQTEDDLLVHHPTNTFVKDIVESSVAQKKAYLTPQGAHIEADSIKIANKIVCQTNEVGLLGTHNLENICAAITASWHYTQDVEAIKKAVVSFKGLPHRLEFVREVNGVKFYNDSFSTGPGATLAALRSFNEPLILLLGGSDKGIDLSKLVNAFNPEKHTIVLIGSSSKKLEKKLTSKGFNRFINLGDLKSMSEIVKKVNENSGDTKIVLLSPAHASFDMFKNVYDRGDQFKKAVSLL